MSGEHVLVTGGCGFIGHHLVARLLRDGERVTVLDDLSTGRLDNLPQHPLLTFVEGSVLDRRATEVAARGVRRVYHLAAIVGMRLASRERQRAHTVAVEGTRRVLEACGEAPAVLFSSSAVYGLKGCNPARESEALDESDAMALDGGLPGYACGKLAMERLGRADTLTVRPFNVVGERQSAAYGMVLPRFLEAARQGRPLTVHDDGRQLRAFSDVGTAVDGVARLVQAGARGVFNVGTAEATSVLELAQIVRQVTGAEVPLQFLPYEQTFPGRQDVRARVPDTARLQAAIGSLSWPSVRQIVERLCLSPSASR